MWIEINTRAAGAFFTPKLFSNGTKRLVRFKGNSADPPYRKDFLMSISSRLLLGFFAGFLSHLIFQGAFGSILYAANVLPALPFSLDPVPPFDVPKTLNLGFWAGLWGVGYALLERQLTPRFGWWLGGLVYGIAPLAIFWFAVLPLKGLGAGGGFDPAVVPIHVGFHEAFGIGLAIVFQAALTLARRRVHA